MMGKGMVSNVTVTCVMISQLMMGYAMICLVMIALLIVTCGIMGWLTMDESMITHVMVSDVMMTGPAPDSSHYQDATGPAHYQFVIPWGEIFVDTPAPMWHNHFVNGG